MTDHEQRFEDLRGMGDDDLVDLAERLRLRGPGNLTFYEAQFNRVDVVAEILRRDLNVSMWP